MSAITPLASRVAEQARAHRTLPAAILTLTLLGALAAPPAWSQSMAQTSDAVDSEFAPGHGSIGIESQHAYYHGDYGGPAGSNTGNASFYTYELEASYFFAPGWEAELSLPYTSAKYSGNYWHPRLPCAVTSTSCSPALVDDGSYHGTFSDWHAELRYHTDLNGYYLTPSIGIYVPSHNYPFYGTGTVGQRLTKYEIGLQLDHQFALSNFYYSAHAQYVILPRTLGIDANYNRVGFDLGYFFSPQLSARAITEVKFGHGYTDDLIGAARPIDDGLNPIWELHDKFRLEDTGNVGAAVDYRFGTHSDYLLSVSLLHSVWGRSDLDLKYDLDLRLTRNF